MFVCMSVCQQDYCKSNQPISLKLGVVIAPTNQKNYGRRMRVGYEKIAIFEQYLALSWKRYKIGP